MNREPSNFDWLFQQALGLSPEQQGEFLQRECQDEQQRTELIELLQYHRNLPTDSFVNPMLGEDAVVHAFDAAQTIYDDNSVDGSIDSLFLRPGKRVGKYRILELLGEGGMGSVFVAEQSVPVQRRVALKVIKPGIDSKEVLARFEAERQALAMMDHPNIAKVLDAGSTETGLPYFVMELVKGVAITEYCDQHRLDAKQRLALFVSVCQAVAHAHQKGIIHRDIKPSNVLIADYDSEPVAKVIDFGVAKATTQKLTDKTIYTRFGQLVGTFEYMSPEQAKLNQLDVDTRSDVYSLGVLLYELITGSTPFDRRRLRSAALNEMVKIICEEDPPKPSTRLTAQPSYHEIAAKRSVEPAQLVKTVRGELDWIVMRSLEKERNRRYQSANAFAKDVERHLSGDVVEACPPTWGYRTSKFIRRYKTEVAVLCLVFGLLSVSSLFGWMLYQQATKRLRESGVMSLVSHAEYSQQKSPIRSTLFAIEAANAAQGLDESVRSAARQVLMSAKSNLGGESVGYSFSTWPKISTVGNRWFVAGRRLWDLQSEDWAATIPHQEAIIAVISPDRNWVVTSTITSSIRLWRFNDGAPSQGVSLVEENSLIMGLVISRDNRRVAASFKNGTVRVWELSATNPASASISLVSDPDWAEDHPIAISEDGRWLVSGAGTNAYLWDLDAQPSRKPIRTLEHKQIVKSVSMSSDARWLATSTHKGKPSLWSLTSDEPNQSPLVFPEEDGNPVGANIEQNDMLLTWGDDVCVYDLNVADPFADYTMLQSRKEVVWAGLSPNRRWLATSIADHTVRLWDLNAVKPGALPTRTTGDGKTAKVWSAHSTSLPTFLLSGHDSIVHDAAFTSDNKWLFTAGESGNLRRWDLESDHPAGSATVHARGVQAVDVSPDGRWLAIGCNRTGRSSQLWKLDEQGRFKSSIDMFEAVEGIGSIAFSPDGQWLVTTSAPPIYEVGVDSYDVVENVARVWSLSDPGKQAFVLACQAPVTAVTISGDSRFAITVSGDRMARLWDLANAGGLVEQFSHPTDVYSVDVSSNGRRIVTAGRGAAYLWDLDSDPKQPVRLQGPKDLLWLLKIRISPNGRWVATGAGLAGEEPHPSNLWDLESSRPYVGRVIPGYENGMVTGVEFSPDNTWLVTGTRWTPPRVWDLRVQNPLASPRISRADSTSSLAFSPDSRRLFSSSEKMGDFIQLIDLTESDAQLKCSFLRTSGATSLACFPGGDKVVTAGNDVVQIWNVDAKIDELIESAKRLAGRNLTSKENKQFLDSTR